MAYAHHDATRDNQRRRSESEFFSTEERSDDDVTAGLQLAVGLNDDAAAQIVLHQHLMRFRQTKFPWNAGVLDARQG